MSWSASAGVRRGASRVRVVRSVAVRVVAHRRVSREEARRLAREKHPEVIETPVWEPLRLRDGERIERFYGRFGALLEDADGGGHRAVDSTLPLRSDAGPGPNRLADLSLVDRGATLEPENPLVATEIAQDLDGGIEIGGLGVQLVSPSDAQAEVVEDRAFFASALADSDLIVVPTALGVQLSVQVRSPDAPEQAVLDFDLPEGAQLRVIDEAAAPTDSGSVPGSAEVVRDGQVLSVIQPPAGWDAEDKPLEGVRYAVEGDKLVLHYPHRSADILYPALVDPQIDRFRIDDRGQPVVGSGFTIGPGNVNVPSYQDPARGFASWNSSYGGNFFHDWTYAPDHRSPAYSYEGPLELYSANGSVDYADGSYRQWYYWAPRQSWITRVDFPYTHMRSTPEPYRAMCLDLGIIRGGPPWNFESGYVLEPTDANGGRRYVGQAPYRLCNGNTYPYTHKEIYNNAPTPGNVALFKLFAFGNGKRPESLVQSGGAAVYLEDGQHPTVSSAYSSTGSGWVRSATVTTTVNTRDAAPGTPSEQGGLGMWADGLQVPVQGGGTAQHTLFGNCHLRLTRCTEGHTFQHNYSTEDILADDPRYPETLGAQRMPEGINTLHGDTYDAIGKPTRYQAGTIKVDRSRPANPVGSGSLHARADDFIGPQTYTLGIQGSDSYSGVKRVSYRVVRQANGALMASGTANNPNCYSSGCSNSYKPPSDFNIDASGWGTGRYTVEMTVKDQLGDHVTWGAQHTTSRSFTVEMDANPPTVSVSHEGLEPWLDDDREIKTAVTGTDQESGIKSFNLDFPTGPDETRTRQCSGTGANRCPTQDSETFTYRTDSERFPNEGRHQLRATVTDARGVGTTSQPWEVNVDRTPPELALSGALYDRRDQELPEGSYELVAQGTDGSDASAESERSGVRSLDILLD